MPSVQELIHKFEQGQGRGPRIVFVALVIAILMLGYNWRCFRNMGTQEAMDSAQVAHNLAQGHGFTTQFIRPFSIYLVKTHNADRLKATDEDPRPDYAQLKVMHPDLANPPVYPLVLAGLMKVLPFQYEVNLRHPFWSTAHPRPTEETPRMFARYQP